MRIVAQRNSAHLPSHAVAGRLAPYELLRSPPEIHGLRFEHLVVEATYAFGTVALVGVARLLR